LTRIVGPKVTLRGFRAGEFDVLWADQVQDLAVRLDVQETQIGEEFRDRLRRRVAASGTWTNGELVLAVEADGGLGGVIQARTSEDILPPHVFEIGIQILAGRRDRGLGTEALWLLTDHLFNEEAAIRVQLSTELGNGRMRGAAEAAGYSFEGVMRSFWPVPDGSALDHALYAMTRSDHERAKPPWTRTS
jgi:RimJ/RimL family protein N-acetyltransferase